MTTYMMVPKHELRQALKFNKQRLTAWLLDTLETADEYESATSDTDKDSPVKIPTEPKKRTTLKNENSDTD